MMQCMTLRSHGGGRTGRKPLPVPAPTLGGRLRHLRLTAGLSQTALAARVNVSQSLVSRWEAGRATPTAEAHAALERVLRRATPKSRHGGRPRDRLL